jgi:hypothetical protein
MNRFVSTALALAAVGSAANAGTGDNEWLELDSEINGLSSTLQPSQDGTGWAALIRAVYTHSSDDIATGGGSDVSGFNFNDVDLAFWGSQGPYMWRISTDIDSNEAGVASSAEFTLEDAYVAWDCGGYFRAQMGQFKPRITRSNSVDPEHLVFIDRSVIGSAGDYWDNGIGVSGTWEQLNWYASVLNGSNGHLSDHTYVLRGEWNLGSGAGMYEGAMGSSDSLNATIGFTFLEDDTFDGADDIDGDGDTDNLVYILDFHGSISQVGFGGEVASFDNDFAATTDEDFSNLDTPLVLADDSTPWGAYVSYLLNPEWEFAVRYEDLDNEELAGGTIAGEDNTVLSVAANWYRGNTAGKWQAQWTDFQGDTEDGSILEVGYSIGASR